MGKNTRTMLVLDSLRGAGFGAIMNLAGNIRVYLDNRDISTMEVSMLLRSEGFRGFQFRTYRSYGDVVVEVTQ